MRDRSNGSRVDGNGRLNGAAVLMPDRVGTPRLVSDDIDVKANGDREDWDRGIGGQPPRSVAPMRGSSCGIQGARTIVGDC